MGFSFTSLKKKFLFSEQGLPVIVALFSSSDRNTQLVACILSGVGIISQACEGGRAAELILKTDEVWTAATRSVGEQDANLSKLTAALCTHATSLMRVSTLLVDPRFAKYGLWLLNRANLSVRHLQQIQGNLTRILEVPDHPYRFQAAELLLNKSSNDKYDFNLSSAGTGSGSSSSTLDGLPAFEKSLEKAILDPLAVALEQSTVNIAKMKSNTTWQVDKVQTSFPKLQVGNDHFASFEKTLAGYLAIQQELRQSVSGNDEYASDLLRIAENCKGELNLRTFSEAERENYIKRLSSLEIVHAQAFEHKRDFREKDEKLQVLTRSLQAKQKEVTDLERAVQQFTSEGEQKKRLVENAKQMLSTKRANLGNNTADQATQIRQRLEQVQERQKTLAMVHMKVQQGDTLNIDPYLTAAGLAVAAQGRVQQVKVEHAHWKQQESQLNHHLQQLSNFDPRKLQEEINMLERQISENESLLVSIDGKKAQAAGKLAEMKVDFESERHVYTSQKSLRDELMKQAHSSEASIADQVRNAQNEIQQRHEGLSNLMRASKELHARSGVLETKMGGIGRLLESEVEHRQNLRRVIASLGQYLTTLDYDLSQLGMTGEQLTASSNDFAFANAPAEVVPVVAAINTPSSAGGGGGTTPAAVATVPPATGTVAGGTVATAAGTTAPAVNSLSAVAVSVSPPAVEQDSESVATFAPPAREVVAVAETEDHAPASAPAASPPGGAGEHTDAGFTVVGETAAKPKKTSDEVDALFNDELFD